MAAGKPDLAGPLRELRRSVAQLDELRREAARVDADVAMLERVLDFEAVARHAEAAIMAGEMLDGAVPRLRVTRLLPDDAYAAVREAIPGPVFLEPGESGVTVVRVPPREMPARIILVWTFMTDLVLDVLSRALIARLGEPIAALTQTRFPDLPPFGDWGVEVTLSRGRLVRRMAEAGLEPVGQPESWDLITAVLDLGDPLGAGTGNTLIASVGAAVLPEPQAGSSGADRWTYEFGVGPTQQGRRRLERIKSAQPVS